MRTSQGFTATLMVKEKSGPLKVLDLTVVHYIENNKDEERVPYEEFFTILAINRHRMNMSILTVAVFLMSLL